MSLRIGLISDPHATAEPLRQALELLRGAGAELLLCAGDIAGYGDELEACIDLLTGYGCRAVLGNHDLWHLERDDVVDTDPYLAALPVSLQLELSGVRLTMVHASPPESLLKGIRLLDEQGRLLAEQHRAWEETLCGTDADVLVVGHTHQVFAVQLGNLLVVNPGSTRFNHSCALLSLPEREVSFFPLGGRQVLPVWNWGMERGRSDGE